MRPLYNIIALCVCRRYNFLSLGSRLVKNFLSLGARLVKNFLSLGANVFGFLFYQLSFAFCFVNGVLGFGFRVIENCLRLVELVLRLIKTAGNLSLVFLVSLLYILVGIVFNFLHQSVGVCLRFIRNLARLFVRRRYNILCVFRRVFCYFLSSFLRLGYNNVPVELYRIRFFVSRLYDFLALSLCGLEHFIDDVGGSRYRLRRGFLRG